MNIILFKCHKCSWVKDDVIGIYTCCTLTCGGCGVKQTYHKTPCCNVFIKVLNYSANTVKYSHNIAFCICGLAYEFTRGNGVFKFEKIDNCDYEYNVAIELYTINNRLDVLTGKLSEIKILNDKIDSLSSKLTRLLDMIEFSPDGGPGAAEAKKLFTEHSASK